MINRKLVKKKREHKHTRLTWLPYIFYIEQYDSAHYTVNTYTVRYVVYLPSTE